MHDHHGLAGERPVLLPIIRWSENPGAVRWPDRMKGGFGGRFTPASFGAAVWVIASMELISAIMGRVASAGSRQPARHLPNLAAQGRLSIPNREFAVGLPFAIYSRILSTSSWVRRSFVRS